MELPFIELQSVDSTNNYARQQIHADRLTERQGLLKQGTAFFAHEQMAGKGQRGKSWDTEKSANIILSIVVKPAPLPLSDQFQLSACAAVAGHQFFSEFAGTDTKIKWPNDLYWQDRKAGGILIESVTGSVTGRWDWAIIGIGININQTIFPSYLTNPVSLKQITGKHYETVLLGKRLHQMFMQKFNLLQDGKFGEIYSAYVGQLYKKGEKVRFKKATRVFEAEIKTVLPNGKLLISHSIEEEIDFGNIEWLR